MTTTASARRSGDPVDAPDDLWKMAIYWVLERRLFTGSPSLLHDDPDGDGDARSLPHVARYRFVGVGPLRRPAGLREGPCGVPDWKYNPVQTTAFARA
jgi:hypothetical protein